MSIQTPDAATRRAAVLAAPTQKTTKPLAERLDGLDVAATLQKKRDALAMVAACDARIARLEADARRTVATLMAARTLSPDEIAAQYY